MTFGFPTRQETLGFLIKTQFTQNNRKLTIAFYRVLYSIFFFYRQMISERGGFIINFVNFNTLIFYCVFKSTEQNTAALDE